MDNHVKFARFVLLPGISDEAKHEFHCFFRSMYKKTLLDSVFVIYIIIKVSVKVIDFRLRLRLIKLTPTLIVLDNTKTSTSR